MMVFISMAQARKLNEITMSIVGTVSLIILYNVQGSIMHPAGFYISKVFGN